MFRPRPIACAMAANGRAPDHSRQELCALRPAFSISRVAPIRLTAFASIQRLSARKRSNQQAWTAPGRPPPTMTPCRARRDARHARLAGSTSGVPGRPSVQEAGPRNVIGSRGCHRAIALLERSPRRRLKSCSHHPSPSGSKTSASCASKTGRGHGSLSSRTCCPRRCKSAGVIDSDMDVVDDQRRARRDTDEVVIFEVQSGSRARGRRSGTTS